MLDLTQFLTVGGLSSLVMLLVTFLKVILPLSERRYIPYVAVALGVALALLFGASTGHIHAPADWVSYGVGGLLVGLGAIGLHEATLDKIMSSSAGSSVASAGTLPLLVAAVLAALAAQDAPPRVASVPPDAPRAPGG